MDRPASAWRTSRKDRLLPSEGERNLFMSVMNESDSDPTAAGDTLSNADLFALIYNDLHARAHRLLSSDAANSLSTSSLVHEAWFKLAGSELKTNDKAHFFRIAIRAMRQILVDKARYRSRLKRDRGPVGADEKSNEELSIQADSMRVDVLALEQAIERLTKHNARAAEVLQLHFFAGLGYPEIAELLETPLRTVERDWQVARAYLYRHLSMSPQ